MRLSTKGRYAIIAMLELAVSGPEKAVTLAEISEKQDLSLSYLEQLFSALRKNKLVRGVRGPGGGYYLAEAPDKISVAQIVDSVEERIDFTRCGGKGNCENGEECLTHYLWAELSKEIHRFLADISLADILKKSDC